MDDPRILDEMRLVVLPWWAPSIIGAVLPTWLLMTGFTGWIFDSPFHFVLPRFPDTIAARLSYIHSSDDLLSEASEYAETGTLSSSHGHYGLWPARSRSNRVELRVEEQYASEWRTVERPGLSLDYFYFKARGYLGN